MNIKDTYTKVFVQAANQFCDNTTIKNLRSKWWTSTRCKDAGGLRITTECLEYIQTNSQIKTYKVDLPRDLVIGPQILIWLDQFLQCPYHLEKKSITVLTEKAAFELYLFSGDVRKMTSSKAMAKQLSQE
jgi:hypothetical protein